MAPGSNSVSSPFNRVFAIVVWVLAAVLSLTATMGDERTLWVYPASAFAAFLAWAALWRPRVSVSGRGVDLRNVFHTVQVPWEALIEVDTKYALTLHTPGRRYTAWSAPAPGLRTGTSAARHGGRRESRTAGRTPRTGDLLGTDSGDAALLVREAWSERVDSGRVETGVAERTAVTRTWDAPVIATTAVLGALTLLTLALTP